MGDPITTEALIARLAGDLRPVRRLAPPWQRALLWLGAVLWLTLLLSLFTDFHALAVRLMSVPDMWIAETGAVLTAITAGWAALHTSIPGRRAAWAWLPVPPLLLWLSASTAGCLRLSPVPSTLVEPAMHPMVCIAFLLLVSVPLGAVLGFLLIRACPLRPGLTALLAGMASAAAAASLLALIHPFDATVEDLGLHLVAILVIIGVARVVVPWWGARR